MKKIILFLLLYFGGFYAYSQSLILTDSAKIQTELESFGIRTSEYGDFLEKIEMSVYQNRVVEYRGVEIRRAGRFADSLLLSSGGKQILIKEAFLTKFLYAKCNTPDRQSRRN